MTVLGIFLAASLTSQLPRSSMPGLLVDPSATYDLLWPQGWGFFSAAPRKERTVAYPVSPGGMVRPADLVQMHPSTWWGWRRSTYFRLVETDALVTGIPDHYWMDCHSQTVAGCLNKFRNSAQFEMVNPYRGSTLCGE